MAILITGATGFIGRHLVRKLSQYGIELVILTRTPEKSRLLLGNLHTYIQWDGLSSEPPQHAFSNVESIIHLMGEGIADKRWTSSQKNNIQMSRILGTRHLVQGAIKHAPHLNTFISASAIGYYDHTHTAELTTQSPSGHDFLATLCQNWEAESRAITRIKGVREVRLRIGLVLGQEGGALHKIKRPFSWGVGGPLGNGRQWMNWIHVDDLTQLMIEALHNTDYAGAYNGVAPGNVTNKTFTSVLGTILKRPTLCWVPGFLIQLLLGDMAVIVLRGQRIIPSGLSKLGFTFKFPQLTEALENSLMLQYVPHLNKKVFCHKLYVSQYIHHTKNHVFDFFSDAYNLEKITPSFLKFKILNQSTKKIQKGTQFNYQLKLRGLPIKWRSEISSWSPPHSFVDTQLNGPYRVWHHTHSFFNYKEGTLIEDEIYYALPRLGLLSYILQPFIHCDIENIFKFRKRKILDLFKFKPS